MKHFLLIQVLAILLYFSDRSALIELTEAHAGILRSEYGWLDKPMKFFSDIMGDLPGGGLTMLYPLMTFEPNDMFILILASSSTTCIWTTSKIYA